MLPGDSTREYVIFDGIDKSISFMDFVRQLESFPYCTDAFSVSQNMENVVPTYLYGEALRFYETLDPDCQEDWAQLRSKMVRRFPGIIRSGGLVRRSTTQWDEEGLPTLAKAPPTTSSKLAILVPVIDEAEDTASDPQEDALGQRRSFLSLSVLKGRLRVPSFSRALGRPGTPLQPYVTVHSMFISSTYGGTDLIPICTVDLSDPQAVAAAKKAPLLTLHSYNPASRYLVGFTYTVHCDERNIDFCHKVLAPWKSRRDHVEQMGEQTVSPTRPSQPRSQAYFIKRFIYDHRGPSQSYWSPGVYTIKSHLRSRKPRTFPDDEREKLGEITWIFKVV